MAAISPPLDGAPAHPTCPSHVGQVPFPCAAVGAALPPVLACYEFIPKATSVQQTAMTNSVNDPCSIMTGPLVIGGTA